jgi:hypothetical protein
LVNSKELQLVDGIFFKSTGMLMAVLLSLRAKMASSRRQQLMLAVVRMMNDARTLLYYAGLMQGDCRSKLRRALRFIFWEVAKWISLGTTSSKATKFDLGSCSSCCRASGYPAEVAPSSPPEQPTPPSSPPALSATTVDLADVPHEFREGLFAHMSKRGGKLGVYPSSPRGLLLYLREIVDDLIILTELDHAPTDDTSKIRRWHRTIDGCLSSMLGSFDFVVSMQEENHSEQYQWLISFLICGYLVLYPWCITHEGTWMTGLTTWGIAFVLFGLNAVTHEHENPFGVDYSSDFNLRYSFLHFFDGLEREDALSHRVGECLEQHRTLGHEINSRLHDEFLDELALEADEEQAIGAMTTELRDGYTGFAGRHRASHRETDDGHNPSGA